MVFDKGGEWEVVEEVGEVAPYIGVPIFTKTFVVEAVDLGDLARLVISTEDGDALAVSEFHGDQEGDGLDRVVATIDVVSHEEVVGIWRVASDAEELGEIVLLLESESRIDKNGAGRVEGN